MGTMRSDSHRPLHHELLDLGDRFGRIQPLRADVDAVHDRVTAEQPVRVLEVVEPLARRLVARVGDEPIRREQTGGADELVRVPPEPPPPPRAPRPQHPPINAVTLLPSPLY